MPRPALTRLPSPARTRGVVLLLHGGAQYGEQPITRRSLPHLRMLHLAAVVHGAAARHGIAVWTLRNRFRGWNAPRLDPVRDARWAMARLRARHPEVPVALVGHSMGGRVAIRLAEDPQVTAVCALAPWTTDAEWVSPLRGVRTLIVHGCEDDVTSPESSYAFASRAAEVTTVARFELPGEGHRMLRRAPTWNRLVRAFVLESFGLAHPDPIVARAWQRTEGDRLRLTVAAGGRTG
ncbi:alpha/beta fold hydrolase [Haloechinothrix sp. LS1_15]|uniref:alpha/beta hydrolase n=1 Tax=Haloechinothrix sp. LS1_15 TaxID=2652248 RepID=UPI0029485D7B|nr:alpha/beta fold hydrolase [Haloechinothrix sp. LS1_15]MDV6013201.1 alpha/beta hydrolase [Haloechinothrix sp. LS1_15]